MPGTFEVYRQPEEHPAMTSQPTPADPIGLPDEQRALADATDLQALRTLDFGGSDRVTVLRGLFVDVLDQDTYWCSRRGDINLDDMDAGYATNLVGWLERQAGYLCVHYFAWKLNRLGGAGRCAELTDAAWAEALRVQHQAATAQSNPKRWLHTTKLVRRLDLIATFRCHCGGPVGKREPGDAAGLGCLDVIEHDWHPHPDHQFTAGSGMECEHLVDPLLAFGTECGLPAAHPVHLGLDEWPTK